MPRKIPDKQPLPPSKYRIIRRILDELADLVEKKNMSFASVSRKAGECGWDMSPYQVRLVASKGFRESYYVEAIDSCIEGVLRAIGVNGKDFINIAISNINDKYIEENPNNKSKGIWHLTQEQQDFVCDKNNVQLINQMIELKKQALNVNKIK